MSTSRDANDDKSADQLEQKVGIIREHLTDVVSELDYRRHELMDVKGQLRRHAGLVAGILGGALLIAGSLIGLSVYRARKRPRREHLELAPQYEGVGHRVLTAAAGAAVAAVAKGLVTRLMQPVIEGGSELRALPD